MKAILTAGTALLSLFFLSPLAAQTPKFRHVENTENRLERIEEKEERIREKERILSEEEETLNAEADTLRVRSLEELLAATPSYSGQIPYPILAGVPKVFSGYEYFPPEKPLNPDTLSLPSSLVSPFSSPMAYQSPEWLTFFRQAFDMQDEMVYLSMIESPHTIYKAFWDLPIPPSLPEDDLSYQAFIRRNPLSINVHAAVIPEQEIEKRHWLHIFNVAVQFSQAYLSKNWYQGGSNYLSLLSNLLWDVQLNQTWHPNMIFQSTLSYKLGLNATHDNQLHKYTISEDLFQYNLKFGYKAAHHWYYSFTTQFKTQLLNNYPIDSEVRTASFLTPSNLNLGLGMTYTKENAKKTIVFNASISPLSYNLITAIDPNVDHNQFGLPQSAKTQSKFGSSAEITFNWKLFSNIFYNTRLFLFTDYHNSQADWQNTLEFQFNRFFSTQLYANLRYDSTADIALAPNWKRWMLKEILSVGLSYTFNTKP